MVAASMRTRRRPGTSMRRGCGRSSRASWACRGSGSERDRDVDGVRANVLLRAFSQRRADIEAELERRGASSAGAAQVAAVATRRAKDYGVSPEQLVPEWRQR